MILKKAGITNFRSIKDLEIEFTPSCLTLVGINESGKSNIIKALSHLDPENKISKIDLREGSKNDPPIIEGTIRFDFDLEENESISICEFILASSLGKDEHLAEHNDKKLSLMDLCRIRKSGIFQIDIPKEETSYKYRAVPNKQKYKINENWKKPSSSCPKGIIIDTKRPIELKNALLININDYPDIEPQLLDKVDIEYLNALIGNRIRTIIEDNLPETIYWTYDEQHLLPSRINISTFAANPNSCLPLKHMFHLSGFPDNQSITKAIQNTFPTPHRFRNLLERVADNATEHFRKVWKEYKTVNFLLEPTENFIDPTIQDTENRYPLNQRSEGFKRFVSFLLMISTRAQVNQLKKSLILIDEPDYGLHPSACKFLRDELINISSNNTVVFSTHSIFMIDPKTLGRHLIITKDKEVTSATKANQSNYFDEEVIFNALGYSVFQVLQATNFIFEGWRDKKLFLTALNKKGHKDLEKKFKNIGKCHAKGVKYIAHISAVMEAANRGCIIISDNDKPALEKQKEFNENRNWGKWLTYKDIQSSCAATTGEDFIKPKAFVKPINLLIVKYPTLPLLGESEINHPSGKLTTIKSWLLKASLSEEIIKQEISFIKSEIFDNLKPDDIEDTYFDLLSKLKKLI